MALWQGLPRVTPNPPRGCQRATSPLQRQQQPQPQVQLVLAVPRRAGCAHGAPHPQQSPTVGSTRHRALAQRGEGSTAHRGTSVQPREGGKMSF